MDKNWLKEPLNNALASVHDWDFVLSSQKGTPGLQIDFVLDEVQTDNGEDIFLRHTFWLTDKTFERVLEDLETIGWTGSNIYELDKSSPGFFNLKGKKVRLVVEMVAYDGKMRPRVKYFNDASGKKSADGLNIKALSDQYRAKILAYRQKNKQVPI